MCSGPPGQDQEGGAALPDPENPRRGENSAVRKSDSAVYSVNPQHLQWLTITFFNSQRKCRNCRGALQVQIGGICPTSTSAAGATEGAVDGEESGPEGERTCSDYLLDNSENVQNSSTDHSCILFLPLQDKEIDGLTKLCDELITKVQSG